MSGGSWDYVYERFQEVGEQLCSSRQSNRRALGKKVLQIARAMHDIEWADSCDTEHGSEDEAIRIALGKEGPALVMDDLIERAKVAVRELSEEIERVER